MAVLRPMSPRESAQAKLVFRTSDLNRFMAVFSRMGGSLPGSQRFVRTQAGSLDRSCRERGTALPVPPVSPKGMLAVLLLMVLA